MKSIILMKAKFSLRQTMYTTSIKPVLKCLLSAARRDLGEALRRINEGASMIRTKGEPGTGDVVQAVQPYASDESSDRSAYFHARR